MNAALYIRVSTDDQLEFSPDAQKRALVDYAKKNGYIVNDEYIFIDEGISGTSAKKRPAFMRMIGTAKTKPKPFDAILVHKFDRFARSREDSVVYKSILRKECDIKVISITEQMEDDKFSVILEAMLEAMAEYYSLNLSDEVIKGMTEKARRGGVQCRPALGYDIIKNTRVVNATEAEIVKKVYDMCIKGESVGAIAKHLNLLGYRNKTGNPFDARRIKYLIENPIYMGTSRWNYKQSQGTRQIVKPKNEWIIKENAHEPIVDKKTWEDAQAALKLWHKDVTPRRTDFIHWLAGITRCSKCGATLSYKTARFKRKDGSIRIADGYQCCRYKAGSCDTSNYISVKNLEMHVINILINTLDIINNTGSLQGINVEMSNKENELALYELQLGKLNNKLQLAKKAYLNEIDTLEEYKANKELIQKEIDEINKLISEHTSEDVNIETLKDKITNAIDILNDNEVDVKDKNMILRGFIRSIIYNKAEESLTTFFYI